MTNTARILALALIASCLAFPAAAGETKLAGSWRLDRAASDDVGKAVDATVRKMNFLTRGFARKRLRATNPVYDSVRLTFAEGEAKVTAGPETLTVPTDGTFASWTRQGEPLRVSGEFAAGRFVENFSAPDGRRTNVFVPLPDGRMAMEVTVTSPRLRAPLQYRLVYVRAGTS